MKNAKVKMEILNGKIKNLIVKLEDLECKNEEFKSEN